MIGQRLKVARAAAGLSLRDLSERMDGLVSAQAISKYERDEDMPGSRALMGLSRALGVSVDYLLSDDDLVLEGVDFRKKSRARDEATIEAKTLQLLQRYLAVEDLLGLRSVDWERPRSAPFPVGDPQEAERVAQSVRDEWGLGNDPIPKLAELLEERGVKVLSMPLTDIDGLAATVRRPGHEAARVVVVREDAWAERKRFTLAHELGHMVIEPRPGLNEEAAANRFAGAFLMPADVLRAEVGAHRSTISIAELVALKLRFGASIQAIAYRCKDLAIIGPKAFSDLYRLFVLKKWRQYPYKEPGFIDPNEEKPERFERLCYRALSEGLIGESRAAELLGFSVRALGEHLDRLVA